MIWPKKTIPLHLILNNMLKSQSRISFMQVYYIIVISEKINDTLLRILFRNIWNIIRTKFFYKQSIWQKAYNSLGMIRYSYIFQMHQITYSKQFHITIGIRFWASDLVASLALFTRNIFIIISHIWKTISAFCLSLATKFK